jgi:hypothetical protein
MAAGSIDVERLLQWAYRDELVKRVTSSAEAVWHRVADVAVGVMVDRGYRGSQRYDLGAPHPDALIIEQAVAALPDAVVDWELDAEPVLGHLLALVEPRPAVVERTTARSTTAGWPGKGGARRTARLAPPREVMLVRSLRTSALVIMHASMGTRPDWREEHPHPEPMPAARGTGCMVVGKCERKGWYSAGSYCPLRWWPSPVTIAEARADYLAWWRGLDVLARELKLTEHKALPPIAAPLPWLDLRANH